MACQVIQKKLEEKQLEEERAAKAKYWKLSICYNDDDDEERSDSLDDHIISGLPPFSAITPDEPVLSTEEPDNSLSMGDEHLDTISATESNEFIKFGVENLIPILSESEGIPEHMCDVPFHDNSPPLDISKDKFEDFSESNEEFSSTDDDSFSFDKIDYVEASPPDSDLVSSKVMEIVIPKVGESDFFLEVDAFLAVEDEPTSSQFPKSYLNSEGDMLLFKAFLNYDHSFDLKTKSSSTFLNSLLEETNNFDNSLPEFTTFSKVLFDAECESDSSDDQSCSDEAVLEKIVSKPLSEEEIIPMKSLRTYDSSLLISSKIDYLLEEFDSDSLMEEIDLFCTPDYPMPPGIVDKDYDSERDILIRKDLPRNNTLSFVEKESFHFDILLFSRPPAKPPDEQMPSFDSIVRAFASLGHDLGSSGLRRSSAMPCLCIHVIYTVSLSLYPFTERHAQPYFFSCLIWQTLCFLNYALMIRQDYDITSSLRRGALHRRRTSYTSCRVDSLDEMSDNRRKLLLPILSLLE
nr:hypothetical protein [Tanacetum cinerariifolium]